MSLFSDSLAYGVDTTAVQAGDVSFGSKAGAIVAGAVLSGVHSIYNTAAAGLNALGADVEEVKTANVLSNMDEDMGAYYRANKQAIDVAGFIGTSLLPGTLAIKGLNMVRAGNSSNGIGGALNFFRTKSLANLEKGMSELAVEGGTAFTRINTSKLAAMSWETAEQALQAAVFETAVALTMKQSPLLADDNWWDIGKGIVVGAALGGSIGGAIGALGINKGFKDAVKLADSKSNSANVTALHGLQNRGLASGDEAMSIVESILSLPKEFHTSGVPITAKFYVGGKVELITRDMAPLLAATQKASIKRATEELELSFRKIAAGSDAGAGGTQPETAEAFVSFILEKYNKLELKNASPAEIREAMGDTLHNLTSVKAATDEPLVQSADLYYFKKTISQEELVGIKSIDDLRDIQVSTTPMVGKAYDKPYIFVGTEAQKSQQVLALVGREGDNSFPTLNAAWDAGHSIAQMPNGALRINQNSKLWRRKEDPVFDASRYLNTKTGAVTGDTILTAADRVVGGKRLVVNDTGVIMELKKGEVKTANMMSGFKTGQSVEYATARHAWASKLPESSIPKIVDAADISLLTRLVDLSPSQRAEYSIKHADGSLSSAAGVDSNLLHAKLDGLTLDFNAGIQDTRELAYRYNTTPEWVSRAVETEFGSALRDLNDLKTGMSRELKDFTQRENLVVNYKYPQQFTALDAAGAAMHWRDKRDLILAQAGAAGGQFVTGELAYAYRVQQAIRANQTASAAVLGAEKYSQLPKLAQDVARLADSTGSGASFLGSANAGYGETLKLAAQDIGKHAHGWLQESSSAVASSFASHNARLIDNAKASAEVGVINSIIRNTNGAGFVQTGERTLTLGELANIKDPMLRVAREAEMKAAGVRTEIKVVEDDAWNYLYNHQQLNATRVQKETVLLNARGMTSNKNPVIWYVPPIDTNYFQHFAFVRHIEGKAFGTSETAMVFGRNAEELQRRIAAVDTTLFEVITKDASERFHKAKGTYDFDQTINDRNINSELRKTGALADFFPETRAQNIIEDFMRFHQHQEAKLIRNSIESNYAQQFQQLDSLGKSYVEDATSKFSGTLRTAKSEIANPYEDIKKTMLDISKRSEYPFFHQINEFIDAVGTRAYAKLTEVTGKAQKGLLPWEEANQIAQQYGIKGLYSTEADYFLSNAPRDRSIVKEYVTRANTILSNLVLRFDTAQAVMNVVSTPLLLSTELASIRSLVGKDSQEAGLLRELTSVKIPGENAAVPSTSKLLFNATKNFLGPEKANLVKRYTDNGDIKDTLSLYHEAIDSLSLSPDFKVFSAGVTKASDFIGKWSGNDFAEQFTRFVSADVMRQLTDPLVDAGKMSLQTANSYISTFVNRVQGNYISSQRPVVFQGVLGSAMGLFQTYSFNLLQQLFRHVGDRDAKAIGTMFGMQAGLFGLNGLPMFDAINTHVIGNAAVNKGHYDAYSLAPQLVGKEVGDWLMYGTVSAFPAFGDKWPGLYSRGDINPRHMTILPMTPTDIPAIDASIRAVKNLATIGSKLIKGADITDTLLQGLEHNGINRPLAGLAQAIGGQSTTSKGNLISANSDMDLIANASRIFGAKPMDEAVALNNMYRVKAYQAADRDRMNVLGETVKTHLLRNQSPADEDVMQFMADYTKIGGRSENFNAALQHWSKGANTSVIDNLRRNLHSEPGMRLNEIMDGAGLQDYRGNAIAPSAEPVQ